MPQFSVMISYTPPPSQRAATLPYIYAVSSIFAVNLYVIIICENAGRVT